MTRAHCQNPDACAAKKPTTHCRRCSALHMNGCPERRAKASAAMIERYKDPKFRAEQAARSARGIQKAAKDPNWIERKREIGHKHGAANLLKGHT